MKTTEDKCHVIVNINELTEVQIGEFSIKNSGSQKLLGVNVDSKLNFDCHVNQICIKTIKKSKVLPRVTSYMTLAKKKIIITHFLTHSLTTAPLFGCFIVVKIIIKSNIYMNNV